MSFLRRLFSSISTPPTANMEAAKATAIDKIRGAPVVVFSKSYCPSCRNTKKVLESLGIKGDDKVKYYELDEIDHGSEIQAALAEKWAEPGVEYEGGQRTVPNIFIGGKHIFGGNDGFVKELKQKPEEMQKLFKDAGAL